MLYLQLLCHISCVNTVSSFVVLQLNILLLHCKEYGSNVKLLMCFCVKKMQMVSVDRVCSDLGLFMRWESVTETERDRHFPSYAPHTTV